LVTNLSEKQAKDIISETKPLIDKHHYLNRLIQEYTNLPLVKYFIFKQNRD